MTASIDFSSSSCPLPLADYPTITLAHGGGGRMTQQLIEKLFLAALGSAALRSDHDGAVLECSSSRIAMTTDSHVVTPLFFPGGDIGQLAVYGTVNDLAMCGARPRWLSAGFVLEEGLPTATLWEVVSSMGRAAAACGVQIVTGDTKVVERGKADGLYINTTGVGTLEHERMISPRQVVAGDAIVLSGDIGRHGMAIMAHRGGFEFEEPLQSDCAPLHEVALALMEAGLEVHCMRDLTRGGLSGALIEIAQAAAVGMQIQEEKIEVISTVAGACELMGMDPLYVANEGRMAVILPAQQVPAALEIMRRHPASHKAQHIGTVNPGPAGRLQMESIIGTVRQVDQLSGEQLPRIC